MDSSQGARTGSLLLLGVARAGRALGAGKDAARGEDQDMAVRELLLELTGEARMGVSLACSEFCGIGIAYRCWTRWKPCREGTGTKMTIAFLPWPTSIYSRPKISMRAPGQALDRFPSCSTEVNYTPAGTPARRHGCACTSINSLESSIMCVARRGRSGGHCNSFGNRISKI